MANTILYKLSLDATQFQSGLKKADRALKNAERSFNKVGKNLSTYITAPLAGIAAIGVKAWDKQAKAMAQVERGLISTGNAAGFTKEQLFGMASALQGKTIFGDEEILKNATAQLLTFTNIAGSEFERTQKVALDLATRLDGDLKSATIMVAKAMNDPIANLSAMSRAGVQFSETQKELIKDLWKTGDAAGAQNIILKELERQYGGSAEAAVVGMGKITQTMNSVGDIMEDVGRIFLEIIDPLINRVQDWAKSFKGLDESTKRQIIVIGSLAAAIGPLLLVVGKLIGLLRIVAVTMAGINMPVVLVIGAIAALASGITYLATNWNAVKERISDWSWWKNMLVSMAQFLIEYSPISAIIKGFNELLSYLGKAEIPNPFEGLAEQLDAFKDTPKQYEHEFGNFWDSMKTGAEAAANSVGFSFKKMKNSYDNFINGTASGGLAIDGGLSTKRIQDRSNKLNPISGNTSAVQVTGTSALNTDLEIEKLTDYQAAMQEKADNIGKVAINMSETVQQAFGNMFASFGESLGNLLAGTENMGGILNSIMGMVLDFAANFGKALIAAGFASEAFKTLLANPFAAIAAGTALVALATAAKSIIGGGPSGSSVPALANGGLASGPTLAMVGDNKNAQVDPEVIMPVSKLKDAMGGQMAGGGDETQVLKISNEAIYLGYNRYKRIINNQG